MTDETTDLLIRARGFLERGWCRGNRAKDKDGRPVTPTSERAVAWCADGALIAAGLPDKGADHEAIQRLKEALPGHLHRNNIPFFNDVQKTVEPILAVFDRAIADESEG